MKALLLAAALAALSSSALAGAARDAGTPVVVDKTTTTVLADAGRLGTASLTSLNGNSAWTPQSRHAELEVGAQLPEVDTGTLLVGAGLLALVLARPVGRALRRHEQHRRAAALASTLGQGSRS